MNGRTIQFANVFDRSVPMNVTLCHCVHFSSSLTAIGSANPVGKSGDTAVIVIDDLSLCKYHTEQGFFH